VTIRAIETLSSDEIRLMARDQADAGDPMNHPFEPGTPKASIFERAYLERELQLNPQEG
jgi:hypothetical protein